MFIGKDKFTNPISRYSSVNGAMKTQEYVKHSVRRCNNCRCSSAYNDKEVKCGFSGKVKDKADYCDAFQMLMDEKQKHST